MWDSPEQSVTSAAFVKGMVPPSELRSQVVLDALPIGLAILDPQSRLIYSTKDTPICEDVVPGSL